MRVRESESRTVRLIVSVGLQVTLMLVVWTAALAVQRGVRLEGPQIQGGLVRGLSLIHI